MSLYFIGGYFIMKEIRNLNVTIVDDCDMPEELREYFRKEGILENSDERD